MFRFRRKKHICPLYPSFRLIVDTPNGKLLDCDSNYLGIAAMLSGSDELILLDGDFKISIEPISL